MNEIEDKFPVPKHLAFGLLSFNVAQRIKMREGSG